jgi:site-specific DNA-methyltransferase (adenine-specific)
MYQDVVQTGPERVSKGLQAFRALLGDSDMLAYLSMMAPRLIELRRILKNTGSIYLHCDPAASHYLKVLLDRVFGPENFRNEIVWRRTGAHGARRSFGPIHQTLLFYTKTDGYFFEVVRRPYMKGHVDRRYAKDETGKLKFTSGGNVLTGAGATNGESGQPWRGFDPSVKGRHWAVPGFLAEQMPLSFHALGVLKKLDALYEAGLVEIIPGAAWPTPIRYLRQNAGHPLQDIWAYQPYTEGTVYGTSEGIDADIAWLGTTDPERLGYPTQKPLGLLERIINASCPEDGVVLDPFCGCGTTIATAQALKRPWIGIDVTHLAITLIKHRLQDAFGRGIAATYKVKGEPVSVPDAAALAAHDSHQFQMWALGLVGARPAELRKGPDRGIDGRLYFIDPSGGDVQQIVFSVKGGHLHAPYVRDLRGVVEREHAAIGVLISMEQPTKAMKAEAATAGFFESPWGKHSRVQLVTVAELLEGKRIDAPPTGQLGVTFKKAPRAAPPRPVQQEIEEVSVTAGKKPLAKASGERLAARARARAGKR